MLGFCRCKKIGTNPRTSSSFASTSNVQSSSSSSSSSSTSSKSRLSRVRTPFHKRTSQTQHQLILQKNSKDLKSFNSTPSIKDTKDQQSHSTGSNPDIRFVLFFVWFHLFFHLIIFYYFETQTHTYTHKKIMFITIYCFVFCNKKGSKQNKTNGTTFF